MENSALKGMKGVIMNYRRGRRTQHPKQILLRFPAFNTATEAAKLIGRRVEWKTVSGKTLRGKIVRAHGKKGVVRARFEKGLPGESIGTEITLI